MKKLGHFILEALKMIGLFILALLEMLALLFSGCVG